MVSVKERSGLESANDIVRYHPRTEPWDAVWAAHVDGVLGEAAATLQASFGFSEALGILPAVYFPRIRAGFVIYAQWGANAQEVLRAFPWNPSFIPPPFTSFASPVALHEPVFLLTDVARVVDEVGEAGFAEPDLSRIPARDHSVQFAWSADVGAWVGASSWTLKDGVESIIDARLLEASGVEATTCLYLLPALGAVPTYVPLLYIQANHAYDPSVVEQRLLELAKQQKKGAFSAALLLAGEVARLRSDTWINPKSGLLNQAGFTAVKDDLQRRVANGEWYAEMFFDIDEFKKMNDRCGYLGADWIAAELADRVLFFLQHDTAREYAAHRAKSSTTVPNGFRALLAHVSGDEFKLFVQTALTRGRYADAVHTDSGAAADKARLSAIAEGVVAAASAPSLAPNAESSTTWEERHRRAFEQMRAGILYTGPKSVIATKTTVSLGVSLLDPQPGGTAAAKEGYRPHPIQEEELEPFRTAIEELDTLAERAIEGAKRRGRNRVMFSDAVLQDGGAILSKTRRNEALISLGQIDGVHVGAVCRIMHSPRGERFLHHMWRALWKHPRCIARGTVINVKEREATIRLSPWWPLSVLKSCYLEWESPMHGNITLGVFPARRD